MRNGRLGTLAVLLLAGCAGEVAGGDGDTTQAHHRTPQQLPEVASKYTTFESGQVRPLALSPSGQVLFAVNTPDNRLELFRVRSAGLEHVGSVNVGLEPVAVAVRNENEVWVVNHLSDSISIVRHAGGYIPTVVATLQTGDEPRDIVFARGKAFVTAAHRGQNSPVDPQTRTPGVGRADVFVFDVRNPTSPPSVVTLFSDTPRALAVSKDGNTVYAAAFNSGNETSIVTKGTVELNGGLPPPNTITIPTPGGPLTIGQPTTGLIVKYKNGQWLDATGKDWTAHMKFNLPDKDVFAIDATSDPPAEIKNWQHVGTTLFNMAVNPKSGKIYVANTEARNDVRFEGRGVRLAAMGLPPSVRGHIAESRITVLDGDSVTPRHLNKHINYAVESTPGENEKSIAMPTGMAVSSDGKTLYVAGLGSSKVAIYDTAELESDSFTPGASQVALTGGGPTGMVLDEKRGRVYVMTRFDNGISTVSTSSRTEVAHVTMFNPEPDNVKNGRRFLYDAAFTSSHGDSSCASCHTFGDMDHLAWDLGDPDGFPLPIAGPLTIPQAAILSFLPQAAPVFAGLMPLKGPMTTQSLRGMDNHGMMHWRGDRFRAVRDPATGQFINAQPDTGVFNEQDAFKAFNGAFVGLLGRTTPLAAEEMQAFTDFILDVMYPPNPHRNLDNSLTAEQQAGRDFYFGGRSDRFHNCNGCHKLDPAANSEFGVKHPGLFGTNSFHSFENEPQILKVPHLRNLYQKVGMFGMTVEPLSTSTVVIPIPFMGDQIRGFGVQHDGALDTIDRFFTQNVFTQTFMPTPNPGGPTLPMVPPNPDGIPFGAAGESIRKQLEAFIVAFDSNLAPIVGQQVTLDRSDASRARANLIMARCAAGECDMIATAQIFGFQAAYLLQNGALTQNRAGWPTVSTNLLTVLANLGVPVTVTAVPPGWGWRAAIDRDGDRYADGDEMDVGTDPADPSSHP